MEDEEPYANIREILGWAIGERIVDITQHDKAEWDEAEEAYVMLMFESGGYIKFPVGDAAFEQDDGKPETDE